MSSDIVKIKFETCMKICNKVKYRKNRWVGRYAKVTPNYNFPFKTNSNTICLIKNHRLTGIYFLPGGNFRGCLGKGSILDI
jgi:hypothetical protein